MPHPGDVADADAEGLDLGNQESGEKRAADGAQPADDYNHESIRDHRQVHEEIGRLARDLHRAAQPR